MNKINYQKQLDKVIENLGETKPTLLLHSNASTRFTDGFEFGFGSLFCSLFVSF